MIINLLKARALGSGDFILNDTNIIDLLSTIHEELMSFDDLLASLRHAFGETRNGFPIRLLVTEECADLRKTLNTSLPEIISWATNLIFPDNSSNYAPDRISSITVDEKGNRKRLFDMSGCLLAYQNQLTGLNTWLHSQETIDTRRISQPSFVIKPVLPTTVQCKTGQVCHTHRLTCINPTSCTQSTIMVAAPIKTLLHPIHIVSRKPCLTGAST